MTIAASSRVGGTGAYREVWSDNRYDADAEGDRTSISLIAPGVDIELTGLDDDQDSASGTSFAAPHVVGTVALLQEYGEERIAASAPRWNANARRHEVMKAVLMNSADKLIDDGSIEIDGVPVALGSLLGMERTVVKQDGTSDWRNSDAFDDSVEGFGTFNPLDEQMGAGHLNARRALRQFRSGEYDSDGDPVPLVGWDYGTTTGEDEFNRYVFASELLEGSFMSITLAWDRLVQFETDGGTIGQYDFGDTFEEYVDDGINPPDDSVINDLDIYLLPVGAPLSETIALSATDVGTIEHLFFQIPETGEYEFRIYQWDEDVGTTQDYAVAWWAVGTTTTTSIGDYSGDGIVDNEDFELWKLAYGSNDLAADGNADGKISAADYTVWRDHFGATSGSGSGALAAVPEPSATVLTFAICLSCVFGRGAFAHWTD